MPTQKPEQGESLLRGVRVVEWSRERAAAYAGRLLAGLGARVVRVTPADAARPASVAQATVQAFFHAGKEEAALEPLASAQAWTQLVADADILIEDFSGDPRSPEAACVEAARAACPSLVCVSISPFGLSGPYAGFRAGDLELAFLCGLAILTPRDIAKPVDGPLPPPLKMPASLVSIYSGSSAAAAALTALYAQRRDGLGGRVDVSMLESLVPTLRRELALYEWGGEVATRFMRVWRLAPYGVKPCKDGFVFLQVVEKYHWTALVEMMGQPPWALDPQYEDADYRFEHRRELEHAMAPWLLEQSKHAFALDAQKRGIPFAPVNDPSELLCIPQLVNRGFFAAHSGDYPLVLPTAPYRTRGSNGTAAQPTPGHSEAAAAHGPLAGLRVLDFGHVWAGPYCSALLSDMGADVIKVESRRRVDVHRRQGPYRSGKPGVDRSGVWNAQNRGKRSVTLNLATEGGRELARRMVEVCDVVIENFAPGVMARLGLGYDELAARNPRIVMASLSAFGQEGPQKSYVGYGPSLDAWSGLDWMTSYEGGAPNALGGMFPDTCSGLHGAGAILAALESRRASGKGCFIDLSELEVSALLIGDVVSAGVNGGSFAPLGNSHPTVYPHDCYPCAGEDQWIALSTPDNQAWKGLCTAIGKAEWVLHPEMQSSDSRRRRHAEIGLAIASWSRSVAASKAMSHLQLHGVPCGKANDAAGVFANSQLAAREFFQTVTHPEAGSQKVYGPIWRHSRFDVQRLGPAPALGAETHEVLGRLLHLTPEAIAQLAAEEVVH